MIKYVSSALTVCLAFLLAPGAVEAQTSRIVYSVPDIDEGNPQSPDIWIMDDDGSDAENLTNQFLDVDGRPALCGGTKVVFESDRDGTGDIWIMNIDGTNKVNLTSALDVSHEGDPHCASVDEELQILYVSNVDHSDGEIYKMKADGTQKTRLTSNTYTESAPAWCKEDIVFHRDIGPDDPSGCTPSSVIDEIFLMDKDGESVSIRQLTDDCHGDYAPSCSPDGQQVAFERTIAYAEHAEIFRMDICGGTEPCCSHEWTGEVCTGIARLTFNFFDEDKAPAWSPGGNVIAFSSNRSSPVDGTTDFEIYKMDAVDGELDEPPAQGFLQPVTNNGSGFDDHSPHWGEVRP